MTFWWHDPIGTSASIIWLYWHCQWLHHICKVKTIETRCNMTFLTMQRHWHHHHIMLMALPMTPLHILGKVNWNKVQHDISCHVMLLALTSSIASLHSLSQDDQNEVQPNIFIMWHYWCHSSHDNNEFSIALLYFLCHNKQNAMQNYIFGHMILLASSIAPSRLIG